MDPWFWIATGMVIALLTVVSIMATVGIICDDRADAQPLWAAVPLLLSVGGVYAACYVWSLA